MADTKRVLVVDDDPAALRLLEHVLAQVPDVEIISAVDSASAMALAARQKPALVLLDHEMPGVDGFTACQMIRRLWGDYPGQIWFVTAHGQEADQELALEAGANRLISKPFDPRRMVHEIQQALAA